MGRILKLRDDYHDEFLSFRTKLDSSRGLSDSTTSLTPRRSPTKSTCATGTKWRPIAASWNANLDASGSTSSAAPQTSRSPARGWPSPRSPRYGAGTVLTGGAAAAATALAAWSTGRKLQDERTGIRARHASAWLLRVEEDLTPNRLAEQLRRLVRRLARLKAPRRRPESRGTRTIWRDLNRRPPRRCVSSTTEHGNSHAGRHVMSSAIPLASPVLCCPPVSAPPVGVESTASRFCFPCN